MHRTLPPTFLLWTLTLLGLGTPAYAGAFSGYDTAISGLTPSIAGVSATTVQNGESITVENDTATPLVIDGYYDEPTYKITSTGTYYNSASPSYKLNQEATIGQLGGDQNIRAAAQWTKINGSDILQWHDHRIHWMGSEEPPGVQSDPHKAQVIANWKVPFEYGTQKGAVKGTLSWVPGSRWSSYLVWGAIGIAVIATILIQSVVRPRRKAQPTAVKPT